MALVLIRAAGAALSKVERNPAQLNAFIQRLRPAGYAGPAEKGGVLAWLKENAGNAAAVIASAASFGIMLDEKDSEGVDADVVRRTALGDLSVSAAALLLSAGDTDLSLTVFDGDDNLDKLQVAKEVVVWAEAYFGGRERALRVHAMMQAFFGYSMDDMERAFDLFD